MKPDQTITQALLGFGEQIDPRLYFPALEHAALELVLHDPYAFALAACLDRGTKSEIIWNLPYDIQQSLGHLDPHLIHQLSLDELAALLNRLPRRPRYMHDAPRTIQELTRLVVEDCDGNAALLWKGKRAQTVQRTFESLHGVGPGIASMTVLLIEKAFDVHFPDRWSMDIKPDVHTMRVLHRLGLIQEAAEGSAVRAARALNPKFPGGLDGPLWVIGKTWCHAALPRCRDCPMETLCPKVNV